MAQDFMVTLPSQGPGPLLIDLQLFDIDGNGKKYELTVLGPSLGTVPAPSNRVLQQNAVYGGRKTAPVLLSASGGVLIDANSTALQPIFTVPASTTGYPIVGCIITSMVLRGATVSLTTVSVAAGWNANGNNVYATATHTELTGSTLATPVAPTTGQVIGLPGNSFGIKNSIAQGAPGNFTVDLFGYLF